MPPTELLYPLSRASSHLRPDEGRRPAGGHRVRCRQRRRSLSPAEWRAVSALPLLAAAWAGAAHGDTLTVQATVAAACSAQTATLNLGQYVSGQTAELANTEGAFDINCTEGVPVTVKLGPGLHAQGTERGMSAGGSDVLRYNLYMSGQSSSVWGDGTFGNGLKTIASFSTSNDRRQPVIGRVPGGQNVAAGNYTDQVAITVEITSP